MRKNKIIGYTDGVFDMFHVGHLNIIKKAKEHCDYLIVGVHADDVVEKYKNKKPIIDQNDRRTIVESIKYVDRAVIVKDRDKIKLWEKYHFNIVFIGDDWKGTERWSKIEKNLAEYGVKVVYVPYTKNVSSTLIKEEIKNSNA